MPDVSLTIAERIARQNTQLSASHRRIADYVLKSPFKVAMMTIDKLAAACNVSIATTNRFARVLGYTSYSLFRAALASGFEQALEPVERLRLERTRNASSYDIFAASLYEDQRNAEATRLALSPEACDQAVTTILDAPRIFVVGFGSSGFLAGLLQRGLSLHCPNVETLAGPGGVSHAARQLSRITPEDVVIGIAFPRYIKDTVSLIKVAHEKQAIILALTDKPSSPIAPLASICLYAQSSRQMLSNSDTAVLGLIEGLTCAVAHRSEDSVTRAALLTESVMPWIYE